MHRRAPVVPSLASILLLTLALPLGCSAASRDQASGSVHYGPRELLIYGGEGDDVFLGCLSCDPQAADSVLNPASPYADPNQLNSMYNPHSRFGSTDSDLSACNPHASHPPAIIEPGEGVVGRLTANQFHAERAEDPGIAELVASICRGR